MLYAYFQIIYDVNLNPSNGIENFKIKILEEALIQIDEQ